jgi:hypothetical protein
MLRFHENSKSAEHRSRLSVVIASGPGGDLRAECRPSGRRLALADEASTYDPHNPSISTKRTKLPKAGQPS